MQFLPITYNDLNEIKNLQPDGWSDIIPDIEFYIKSNFCFPVKIKADNKIVGIGASIVYGPTSWLAHIIVDKDYRNKGIGSAIVNKLMNELNKHSIESCLLVASELGQSIYTKTGFRVVTEYIFLKREKPWLNAGKSEKVIPFKKEFRSAIYKLDNRISGEKREILLSSYIENSMVYL